MAKMRPVGEVEGVKRWMEHAPELGDGFWWRVYMLDPKRDLRLVEGPDDPRRFLLLGAIDWQYQERPRVAAIDRDHTGAVKPEQIVPDSHPLHRLLVEIAAAAGTILNDSEPEA